MNNDIPESDGTPITFDGVMTEEEVMEEVSEEFDDIPRNHTRFRDAIWYDTKKQVTVGGAGSIGSWLCLFLSRIGAKIILYEMDQIEEENIGGQFYNSQQIGRSKSGAIHDNCTDYSPETEMYPMGEFRPTSVVGPVVFSCFDNMKARQYMFNRWLGTVNSDSQEGPYLFVDGRLTAENFQLFGVTPDKKEDYQEHLFSDEEAPDLPCSFKSTTHVAAMLASLMTSLYTNFLTNQVSEGERDIPFKTTFGVPLFMFECEY